MSTGVSAELKISAAISRLTDYEKGWAPYLACELFGLIRKEAPGIGTLGVSQSRHLLWDRAYVDSVSVEVLALSLYHEILHLSLKMHERTEAMLGVKFFTNAPFAPEIAEKFQLANMAHDACVNEILRQTYTTPSEWVYPETLGQENGLLFEERFRRLLDAHAAAKQQGKPQDGKGEKGEGNEEGEGNGDGNDGSARGQGKRNSEGNGNGDGSGKGNGKGQQGKGVGQGHCGSCACNPVDGEPQEGGVSKAEGDRRIATMAQAIVDHVAQRGRGSVPGSLLVWAEEAVKPIKVDCWTLLARSVRRAVAYVSGAVDLTWRRPSRRQAGIGFGSGRAVVPALHAPVPEVAVILDTSGSMGQEEISFGGSYLMGILRSLKTRVTFLTCDAGLQGIIKVSSLKEAIAAMKGGGGTDLRPAFEALEKMGADRPNVVICITDGLVGTGVPAQAPSWARVIWVLVGPYRQRPCAWGEMIEIDEIGGARKVA